MQFSALVALTLLLALTLINLTIARSRNKSSTRSRRFAQGRCVHCGYDIRHNPKSCPECGDDLLQQVMEAYRPKLEA